MRKVEFWLKWFDGTLTENYPGWFHKWVEEKNETKALIETPDGGIMTIIHKHMRFTEPYKEPVKEDPMILYDADIENLDWIAGDKARYNGMNLIAVLEIDYGSCETCVLQHLSNDSILCKFAERCSETNTVFKSI